MLLSVHVTNVLFLVWFNNFALTMGLHTLTLVARSYVLFGRHNSAPCILRMRSFHVLNFELVTQ